jgi:hypothetical protein
LSTTTTHFVLFLTLAMLKLFKASAFTAASGIAALSTYVRGFPVERLILEVRLINRLQVE